MREWMRRIAWIAGRVFIFGSFGIWIFWAVQGMVASAQKSAQQPKGRLILQQPEPICTEGSTITIAVRYTDMPVAICHKGQYEPTLDFGAWIEQHCVSVLPTFTPQSIEVDGAEPVREITVPLRCTPDKEPK